MTTWRALAERALLANSGAPPPGWQLVSESRAAVLFRVNDNILVKRVHAVSLGHHAAPLSRVGIEAGAPQYLGPWVPATLFVDEGRGVLVRRFAVGQTLRDAGSKEFDPSDIAMAFGRWFTHLAGICGPLHRLRALPLLCIERLRAARRLNPIAVGALETRLVDGRHPCHGDLSSANVIHSNRDIALIDAETLDHGSLAWDLGHVLALAPWMGMPSRAWRHSLLRHIELPSDVLRDAVLLSSCLLCRQDADRVEQEEAIARVSAA